MNLNPFVITKAEEFNHSYELLASLMHFRTGVADVLLSNTNVIIEGSRGSGKSMYLRMLSLPVKTTYESMAEAGTVDALPVHKPFVGVYVKLVPTIFGPNEHEGHPDFERAFQQLFNIYCIECLLGTILESVDAGRLLLGTDEETALANGLSELVLSGAGEVTDLRCLFAHTRTERRRSRQALGVPPLTHDSRSQADVLWEAAELVSRMSPFAGQRVHFLVDEYDSLSTTEQRIFNRYLRRRDFPVTFNRPWKNPRI